MIPPGEMLLLVLRTDLLLAYQTDSRSTFRVGEVEFRAPDDNYLTAFYDRVVDSSGRLIAIRVHPVTEFSEALLEEELRLSYLERATAMLMCF